MAEGIHYVYAILQRVVEVSGVPAGIDDQPVHMIPEGPVVALASELRGAEWTPAEIESRSANVDWLAPRATAHDRVVTWASDRGDLIPLPMFSLYSDAASVRAMLAARRAELLRIFARVAGAREYGVRVFRLDQELSLVLADRVPAIAELERSMAAAAPGQRYLLGRKLEVERRSAIRDLGARVSHEVFEALSGHARESVREPLMSESASGAVPGTEAVASRGAAVLSAAFLLGEGELPAFQRALTAFVAEHEGRGFRFEFSGPWPPYHFVADRSA